MSNELKRLRKIGAQQIHQDTHIALVNIRSVLQENFGSLNKTQFLGFISILEREYKLDLSSLKENGLAYFAEDTQNATLKTKIFLTPKKRYNFSWFYIVVALFIFIVAVYYSMMQSKVNQKVSAIDNSAIENATSRIVSKPDIQEKNVSITPINTIDVNDTTLDENITATNNTIGNTVKSVPQKTENKPELKEQAKELIILPKSRVWIGYINATTRVKKQTVTRKKFVLDASQTWLLSFGHTHINIKIDKKSVKVPSSNKSMRFIYKNNELKQLSITEFKKLNRGRIW